MMRLALGLGLVAPGILLVLCGLLWVPFSPEGMVAEPFRSPALPHPFGTDWFGRDLLARVMVGGRVSFAVALLSVAGGGTLGALLGLLAGYFRGALRTVILSVSDGLLSFPPVLLALVLAAVFGRGIPGVVLALGFFNLPYFLRLAHAATLALREREFVLAATAAGASASRLLFRHILPHLASPLLVQGTASLGAALLAEASLAYLGLGVQPPHPTWGRMIWEAQSWLGHSFLPALFPGLVLALTVLGLNVLGDLLRDLLDPRVRPLLVSPFGPRPRGERRGEGDEAP